MVNRIGISKLDICDGIDEQELMQHRLLSVLNMIYSDNRYNEQIDVALKDKVLEQYLKTYDQYKLSAEKINE